MSIFKINCATDEASDLLASSKSALNAKMDAIASAGKNALSSVTEAMDDLKERLETCAALDLKVNNKSFQWRI